MSEETNKRIGDYQILNELGSGGMGRVYRVRNVISDRIEAMKILLPDLAGRQELATRFLREIKLMASLNHPNIAQLRTAFTADNQLVMIMEYVEGTTLADRLEHGPIPAPEALNYISQVLNALSYAHHQHVIHRDIKPANIMVTGEGAVKLMDFGIARAGDEHSLTMTGTTLGSLGYMSPEQVKGEGTDARSDLYSVGVSLYEMVTGQRPFRADSDYSLMSAHVRETPKPPLELQPRRSQMP
jgi:eukaryotic-like serine/threonine-protein kinase